MTNDEIRNLRAGDTISQVTNGRTTTYTLCNGGRKVKCSNERSGAFGHWAAANVERPSVTGNGWYSFSIESDEYTNGAGYPTHQDGVRIRGCELVHKATDEEHKAALALGSEARQGRL